jgi:hypothetical protein
MDYRNFQNAIQGAGQVQAPTTDPALAALFGSSFQLAQSNRGANGIGAVAGYQAQADKNAQEIAAQQKAQDLKIKAQKLKDMQDPNKFQKVRKDDGGFDFYDPLGNKIGVQQFSQVTGKSPKDILKDSENSLDVQYLQDYKTMQEIANAYANNDKDTLDEIAARGDDPNFFKGKTGADILNMFKNNYSHVYGRGNDTGVRRADQAPDFVGGSGQIPQPEQSGGILEMLKSLLHIGG